MSMHKFLLLTGLIISLLPAAAQTGKSQAGINKQTFPLGETLRFKSAVLKEERVLNIYLPASYHPDSAQRYPVIYLLDGSADEDFVHIAGLIQFGTFPWIQMLPECILVGIGNVDRRRDFTFPTRNAKDKADNPTMGGSALFIRFLEEELQPLVNAQYKTNGDKMLIGQSLGGLVATEILFKKPGLFNRYVIVSPSLWWDDQSLLEFKPVAGPVPKAVYVAVGKEGKVMEKTARSLFAMLKGMHWSGTDFYFHYFKAQNHGDVLHHAVYDAFERIYRKK